MSKDIEKIEEILKHRDLHDVIRRAINTFAADKMCRLAAHCIYNKGFRDITNLRDWLKEMIEKSEKLSKDENGDDIEMYCGSSAAYIEVLDKLESL